MNLQSAKSKVKTVENQVIMSKLASILTIPAIAQNLLGGGRNHAGSAAGGYWLLSGIVVLLLLLLIARLYRKLKQQEVIIASQNSRLAQITLRLNDQALLREKYIGHFFAMASDYISRIERLKRGVERKLAFKKYDDILVPLNEINIKKEREKTFAEFDKAFLAVFPAFVSEFNAMLKPEDQMWPSKPGLLTKELRIFALMRLGITDCATMSNILEYTANTVYVYKMRVRSRSVCGSDEFEEKLMSIKAADVQGALALRKSA